MDRFRGAGTAALAASLWVATAGSAVAGDVCPRFVKASDGLPTRNEWRTYPSLADVNADGHLDLAGLPRKGKGPHVWLGDGKGAEGTWTEASTGLMVPGVSCGLGVDFADVDGDGFMDLVAADHCQGIYVYLGDGKGNWRIQGHRAIRLENRGFDALELGDVNGDGHVDLVGVGSFRGGIALWYGDGKGEWERQTDTGLPTTGYGPDVVLADINKDGVLDIASSFMIDTHGIYRKGRKLPVIWLSGPDGKFRDSSKGISDGGDYRGLDLGDVNGDGFLDLAISGGGLPDRSHLLIYLGDGGKSWREAETGHPPHPVDAFYEGVNLGDLDNDGDVDLVGVSHRDAGVHIFVNDGKGGWTFCSDTGLPLGGRPDIRGWGAAITDVNADGKKDLAVAFGRTSQGSLEVWVQQ